MQLAKMLGKVLNYVQKPAWHLIESCLYWSLIPKLSEDILWVIRVFVQCLLFKPDIRFSWSLQLFWFSTKKNVVAAWPSLALIAQN